ncbi:MAG TPA: hypothetical protein ENN90_03255 [Mariniphaga anaerophila]|uniref:Uncharacterized protein n=1 Tax=Mariniphaga anaerophila TaxID=1484053 RepID=A0A831LL00_9BACT|nr:hypothetical protein [Mariniphaga anaerophila]
MKKAIVIGILFIALFLVKVSAQNKVVLLDISQEDKSEYLKVSPQIFEQYQDIIENQFGATLIINEDREVDSEFLEKTDILIVLSTLSSTDLKKTRTETEIESIISFVKNGGRLIFFTDEDRRIDIKAFGANEIITPFGMEFGNDLPNLRNAGAISFIGEFIAGKYELPYSGSRELTGGIPISVMNAEGGHVHGAYIKLANGGKLAAFGETMVGLFIGGVEFKMPDGNTIVWKGKDNKQFMKELIAWTLED